MAAWAGFEIGLDQSLQVASGRAELPLRVRKERPETLPRQLNRPQRATVPASRTGASNHPPAAPAFSSRNTFPRLPVAARSPFGDGTSRIASPSLACAMSVAFPGAAASIL